MYTTASIQVNEHLEVVVLPRIILSAIVVGQLLDLTAAFDVIDHCILTENLKIFN